MSHPDIIGNYNPRLQNQQHLSPPGEILTSGKTVVFQGNGVQFERDGQLAAFVFYCQRTGTMKFQIWRPATGSDLTLIDEYSYTATGSDVNEYVYVDVTASDMYFLLGDTFGISYSSQPLVGLYSMSCSYTDMGGNAQTASYVKYASSTSFTIGRNLQFFF